MSYISVVFFYFSSLELSSLEFFSLEFSSLEFSLSEFSLSESGEISILSIICLGIFFSLTTYLYSSENTFTITTCSKKRIDQNY